MSSAPARYASPCPSPADSHEFDARHKGVVALAVAHFEDTCVAARPLGEGRPYFGEEIGDGFVVAQLGEGAAAVGDAVFFRQGDKRFGEPPKFFGLGVGRADRFVLEQRDGEGLHGGLAVGRSASKPATCFTVSHVDLLLASRHREIILRTGGLGEKSSPRCSE